MPPNRLSSSFRLQKTLCSAALACFSGIAVHAQESIRPSQISSLASEARQEQPIGTQGGLMRLGPVNVDASAQMDLEFNDNVGLSESNRKSDGIFRPRFNLDASWQVSRLNSIRLGLGVSYAKYFRNSHLDTQTMLIDPGTQFGFDIFVGDHLRLNIHDRIQIVQNPVDETTLSNVSRFTRLQNSAGVTAFLRYPEWDFVLGYDHFIYDTLSSEFSYLDRSEEQFFASARHRVNDALGVGLEASAAVVRYDQNVNNDATSWTIGAFADATLSEYTRLRLSGGWQELSFDANGTSLDRSDFGGAYVNLSLAQRLTPYFSHTVSAGREARLGLSVNYADYVYARYAATWRMNAALTWTFDAFVEDADESGGAAVSAEHALRWGGGVAVAIKIATRMTLGLRYGYVNKDSDLALRSYYQNSGVISLNYRF